MLHRSNAIGHLGGKRFLGYRGVPITLSILLLLVSIVGVGTALMARPQHAGAATSYPIGIELGFGDSERSIPFVDVQRMARGFTRVNDANAATTLDANGWPTTDATEVLFDMRPFGAWAPPEDDPDKFQPDVSGTYHISFTGQAVITPYANDSGSVGAFTISNQQYNSGTNTTTADLNMQTGKALLVVSFSQTKRNPGDAAGTGITNLKVIRPGYDASQTFTNAFINAINPFSTLRFMEWLSSNNTNPTYPAVINWADRKRVSDASQVDYTGKRAGAGVAWEYVVQLANQTNKDLWINIPVGATDDYVTKLANLLKYGSDGVNPYTSAQSNPIYPPVKSNLRIYFEYSNEMWNYGAFTQPAYNRSEANDKVQQPGSKLNDDNVNDQYTWAQRLYSAKMVNFSNLFKNVYGASAINTTVLPVLCWQFVGPYNFEDQLKWIARNYGAPNSFLYGIGGADYASTIYPNNVSTSSTDSIINGLTSSSDYQKQYVTQLRSLANNYSLHLMQYETGIDLGQNTNDLPVKFAVNRTDTRIQSVLGHHLVDNWYANGGELAIYYTLASSYSRYGFWGLTEDVNNLNTLKYQKILQILGASPTATPTSQPTSTPTPTPTNTPTPMPGNTMYLSDLTWSSANDAAGGPKKDRSINGNILQIGSTTYSKGLGTHAASTIIYNLAGQYQTFLSDVGVDHECASGTVVFQVFLDGTRVYDSGVVTGNTLKNVNLNVSGKNELKLVVTDAGDGLSCDHADWANARLSSSATTPGNTAYLSDLTWNLANDAAGGPKKDQSVNGRTLSIGGASYSKGLGAHAPSNVIYNLNGQYQRFVSDVGVDAECPSGTVVFQVYVDGGKVFDSGTMTGNAVKNINLNVSGKNELKLVVTDAGDGLSCDHADWANASVS